MENQQNTDFLGTAKIPKLMLKFCVPCVLSLLVSALYNIVDQIFVGNSELSTLGNAATGVVFPIFIIAQAFAWWFGDGCAAYLSIHKGRSDTENTHKCVGTGITITVIASLVLLVVFYPLKTQILTLFGASENSIDYAIEYFNIILGFFPIYMASNMINAVVRADGSPSWSMFSMLLGAVINIILDPIFIFACHWGMAGAAWATVIGQVASFVVSIIYLFRTKNFKLKLKSFIPRLRIFAEAIKLGMSSFITQLTIVIISLVCNIMLAKYGAMSKYGIDIPIALIGIESKVFTVVINIVVGIVLGCQPIIGYNIGARKLDRVAKLYKSVLLCTVVIGVVSTLLFELAPGAVASIFGKPTNIPNPDDYWDFARKLFRIFLSLVTFTCTIKMSSIFFQAVGKPIFAVLTSLIRDIVCFVPLICILPLFYGIDGILAAAPIADAIAMIVTAALTIVYFKSLARLKKSAPSVEQPAALDEQEEKSGEAPTTGSLQSSVIVTIAREHGSSGKQIAKLVAEKLGLPFYYKEMIAIAAQESGLDKEFISDINADAPSVLKSLYLSTDAVSQAVSAQEKAINMIADKGSCVIVGRAADYVLRERSELVSIFVHAPEEYRTERIKEVYGDSQEEALKNIRRSDKARAAYYKNISGKVWGDTRNYDFAVDSSIGVEQTAEIIADYIIKKVNG